MDRQESLISYLQSRIKSQNEMIDLLKDYNDSLKERNNDLKMQIIEMKSGHLCCLEPNCPNRVAQRIRRIEYRK
jgi:hypothetical protein